MYPGSRRRRRRAHAALPSVTRLAIASQTGRLLLAHDATAASRARPAQHRDQTDITTAPTPRRPRPARRPGRPPAHTTPLPARPSPPETRQRQPPAIGETPRQRRAAPATPLPPLGRTPTHTTPLAGASVTTGNTSAATASHRRNTTTPPTSRPSHASGQTPHAHRYAAEKTLPASGRALRTAGRPTPARAVSQQASAKQHAVEAGTIPRPPWRRPRTRSIPKNAPTPWPAREPFG